MSFILLSSLLLALSSPLNAHGIVTKIVIGTKTYSGYHPDFQYRPTPPAVIGWTAPKTQDTGPVNSDQYSNPDIICHRGAKPGAISAPVAAGETVTLQWTAWPESHHGPMLDYLAPCNGNCSSVDKAQLKFFKIDGVGMTSTTGSSSGVRPPFKFITNDSELTYHPEASPIRRRHHDQEQKHLGRTNPLRHQSRKLRSPPRNNRPPRRIQKWRRPELPVS